MNTRVPVLALLAIVAACTADTGLPTELPKSKPKPVVAIVKAGGDNQAGVVYSVLPVDLQLRVTIDGTPASGVLVSWTATDGSIAAGSLTNADGVASATWQLGRNADVLKATARGRVGDSTFAVIFVSRATPGAPYTLVAPGGEISHRANQCLPPIYLSVTVEDIYGNWITDPVAQWRVVSGPLVEFPTAAPTSGNGRSFRPTGTAGPAFVEASLPGADTAVTIKLNLEPPRYVVYILDTYEEYPMQSGQNCSATDFTDTIPAGAVMHWSNLDYRARRIESTGAKSFPNTSLIASGSSDSTRFTEPGTYTYQVVDGYGKVTGTIIVR
jgi:hypothetical protein